MLGPWYPAPWLVLAAVALVAADASARKGTVLAQDKPAPSPRDVVVAPGVPDRVADALTDILNDPALDGARVGVIVVDTEHDRVIAESGADELINPASNAKLLTAAGAFAILKPEYRWRTEYFASGPVVDGVLKGDLVVKGYGDPTVVNERLQAVANELYLAGIRRITGAVVVDDTFFDRQLEAKGWELEEAPDRAYAAPVSGLSLNYNAIGVNVRPTTRGVPAVVELDPPVEHAKLEASVMTGRWTRGLGVATVAERGTLRVVVDGDIGARDHAARIYRRVYDPPQYFGSALVTFLTQRGVKVKHKVVAGVAPAGARLLHVDESPPLVEVIADLNHYSNNFIAESVVKTIAAEARGTPGTFANGLAAIREFHEREVGFVPGTFVYENGSGLNDVNRVSARQLARLLGHMYRRFEFGSEFVSSLAVAGTQGTIRHRLKNGPAERRLRAKTGTLRGVSALSGYVVDPEDRVLSFAILVEGYGGDVRVAQVWAVQDRIAEALASHGETWEPEPAAGEPVAEVALTSTEPSPGGGVTAPADSSTP